MSSGTDEAAKNFIQTGPKLATREQPMPVKGKEDVTLFVIGELENLLKGPIMGAQTETVRECLAALNSQREKGLKKYGSSLMTWNGRDAYEDATQEWVDWQMYMTQARKERADLLEANRLLKENNALMEKVIEDQRKDIAEQRVRAESAEQRLERALSAVRGRTAVEPPSSMHIDALVEGAFRNSEGHGFWKGDEYAKPYAISGGGKYIPEKLALMHSELSEALEEFRNGAEPVYYKHPGGVISRAPGEGAKPEGILIELADCCIRIFDLCGKEGWYLGKAIHEKMQYNAGRPYKHGKAI